MDNIFSEIDRYLQAGQRVVTARIIRRAGSSPRATGTGCLVLADGTLKGTIGGGLLEHQVLQRAKEIFIKGRTAVLSVRLRGTDSGRSEMLCGGDVDVYLEPILPEDQAAKDIFSKIVTMIAEGRSGVLITRILEGSDCSRGDCCRVLLGKDGTVVGSPAAFPGIGDQGLEEFLQIHAPTIQNIGSQGPPVFIEPVKPDDVLYLFGGGHISACLAPLAKMAGFKLVVIDDRKEFANRERFPSAHGIVVAPFQEAFDHVHINPASYVVIVTRGHSHDRDVLQQALQHPSAYIGMIGSRRKKDIIYRSLAEDGVPSDQLSRVHCPIGLDIGAETPEEIAVSIMAELIKTRSSQYQ